jgi:hypothetical protein
VISLAAALAAIPDMRDKLNAIDDQLSAVIRHVECVLRESLKVVTPCQAPYDAEHGRFVLGYGKRHGKWLLTWGSEVDDTKDVPLASAARVVRAEVFSMDASGMSPMERLLIQAAESLSCYVVARETRLVTAKQLLGTLANAGFPLVP